MDRFLGTAFSIGDGSLALTAAHVLPPPGDVTLCLMKLVDREWWSVPVRSWDVHPVEDVALLYLSEPLEHAWLKLEGGHEGQSASYRQWGYPDSVLLELVDPTSGTALPRPDLAYFQGYIRRRLSDMEIPGMRGRSFFELSEVSGPGTSGSPLMPLDRPWHVIGIYVGERLTDETPPRRLSYAVREDAFRDWTPDSLGRSILDASVPRQGSD